MAGLRQDYDFIMFSNHRADENGLQGLVPIEKQSNGLGKNEFAADIQGAFYLQSAAQRLGDSLGQA
jgi:hypothetical protein